MKPAETLTWIRPFSLALCLTLSACGIGKTESERLLEAEKYAEAGDTQSAVIELKSLISDHPENAQARLSLGKIYNIAGDGASAEKELSKALELGISNDEVITELAQSLFSQGKHEELANQFGAGLISDPRVTAQVLVYQARSYMMLGDLDRANRLLSTAAELIPDSPALLTATSQLQALRGDRDSALAILEAVLEGHPDYVPAWSLRGDLKHDLLEYEEALASYQQAVELSENDFSDRLKRVFVQLQLGDWDEAKIEVDALKEVSPPHPVLSYADGYIAFQRADYAEAQLQLEQTINFAPDYMPAVFYLGAAHYQQDHLEQAEHFLKMFHARNPDSELHIRLLVSTYLRLEKYERAEALLSPYIQKSTEDAEMLRLIATLALMQGSPVIASAQPINSPGQSTEASELALVQAADSSAATTDPELQSRGEEVVNEMNTYLNYMYNQQFEQALEFAEKLIDTNPDYAGAWVFLGGAYAGLGNTAEAKKAFVRSLEISPGEVNATQNLVNILVAEGDTRSAINLYKNSIKYNPDYPGNYARLSELLLKHGDYNSVLHNLQQWAKQIPQDPDAHYQLATLYAGSNQTRLARKEIEAALAVGENHLPSRLIEARWLEMEGDYASARSSLNKMALLYPTNLELMAQRGHLALQEGRLEDAQALLQQAESRAPTPQLAIYLSQTYYQQGAVDKSVNKIKRALEQFPNNPSLQAVLANTYLLENEKDAAINVYRKALEHSPNNAIFLNNLADLLREGDPSLALQYGERALKLDPSSSFVQDTVGQILTDLGRVDLAIDLLRKAVASRPKDPQVSYHLATALAKKGEVNEARTILEQILEIEENWDQRESAEKLLSSL